MEGGGGVRKRKGRRGRAGGGRHKGSPGVQDGWGMAGRGPVRLHEAEGHGRGGEGNGSVRRTWDGGGSPEFLDCFSIKNSCRGCGGSHFSGGSGKSWINICDSREEKVMGKEVRRVKDVGEVWVGSVKPRGLWQKNTKE